MMCEWYSLIIHCAGIKGIVLFLLFALICNLTSVSRLTQLLDQAFGCDDTASPAENWSRPVLSPAAVPQLQTCVHLNMPH